MTATTDGLRLYQERLNMSKNVNVLEGWFSDTLPRFRNEHGGREGTLSLLRLDGDGHVEAAMGRDAYVV